MSGMIPPIEEMVTPEMLDSMPEKDRAMWEDAIDRSKRRKQMIAEHANKGEWGEALILCDSQERAPILVRAGQELDGDALRELIEHWWSTTEAWSGDDALREGMFAALRKAAPVIVPSDDAGRLQTPPEGRFKVYRGNLGETPYAACGSWTLDRDVAERFARMASGIRGQLVLGMSGPGPASIWQAECDADDVIGFFDDRHEYEIVTEKVTDVVKIAEAVEVES